MYKWSTKRAAESHGIPRSTLQRYLKQCEKDGSVEKKTMGKDSILSAEQEKELTAILTEMESRLYGLSPLDLRKVVYQFCEQNKIRHCFSREKQCAGRKWMQLFFARNPQLSVRKPEGTSIQRAIGYNASKIRIFEEVLKKELFAEDGKRRIAPENIFNVDETGLTVNQKPRKIVAKKGKKTVSVITSAEKGKTITAVCCVSAAGVYCPPLLIFPRKQMKPELLDRGPVGAVAAVNKSGWITEAIFSAWFDHFLQCIQPQYRSTPCLLLMDGHSTHTNNLDVIQKARANNVSLLVLPSHCSHKIQPLDVAIFQSLKSNYDQAVDAWLRNHPGRAVTEYNVAELLAEAWGKAATVANAVSGFAKARIHPFKESDPDDPEQFLGAAVTNITFGLV